MKLLFPLLFLSAALLHAAETPKVVSLRPAIALVQGLEIGGSFSLQENAASGFLMHNGSDAIANVQVDALAPMRHPWQYELGYEPVPDQNWFTVSPATFDIPVGQQSVVDLQANIPSDPKFANRHWMLYVESGPPANMALGAVLKLRARVLIETMPAAPLKNQKPSGYANVAPSIIFMEHHKDGSWSGETQFGHDAMHAATYDVLRVPQLWGHDLQKAHRYFQAPGKAILSETWAEIEKTEMTIEPHLWHTLKFTVPAEKVKTVEDYREELVFLARRTLTPEFTPETMPKVPKAEARKNKVTQNREQLTNPNVQILGVMYDHVELLRLRYYPSQIQEKE